MRYVRFLVVPELMRPDDALQLRIEVREKVRVAEQHPVEERNVVELHDVEDRNEPREEPAESEAVFHAVPRGENKRAREHQNRKYADDPANHMRAAEPLLLIGYRVKILLRRGGEKRLS